MSGDQAGLPLPELGALIESLAALERARPGCGAQKAIEDAIDEHLRPLETDDVEEHFAAVPGHPDVALWCRVPGDDSTSLRFVMGSAPGERRRRDNEAALDRVGWSDRNAGLRLHRVAELKPNSWGLFDMHGNVFEWCADWYSDYSGGPPGPPGGRARVLRGGGCWVDAVWCRSALRGGDVPDGAWSHAGFRVCLSAPELDARSWSLESVLPRRPRGRVPGARRPPMTARPARCPHRASRISSRPACRGRFATRRCNRSRGHP